MIRLKSSLAIAERRMNELEKEYEKSRTDKKNQKRLEELRFLLTGLIGKNNQSLLREYTERLIAAYNKDADWFYKKGVEDARTSQPEQNTN